MEEQKRTEEREDQIPLKNEDLSKVQGGSFEDLLRVKDYDYDGETKDRV